ncbi:Farnesyl pyrophosphate synthase [Microtus ochrogaster]|uniref:(2E,6E)-farnesyl diphosphate synthase n=1 Tax=Microtus ochrogaster TaxID=79684 RepID=A0A8J6GIS4_MICOH|nr:Farnesyl pyrophosphate synthase [Microtus ochrogaster]
MDAVNEALLLEACIYCLLKFYCMENLNLLELFLQSSYQTEIRQTLDLMSAPRGHVNLAGYTEKRYKSFVKYKTAFYFVYLPVAAAMRMAGIDGEKEHANAMKILQEMGEFFLIQDEHHDLFGDPSVTGKFSTDIQDNKCSCLVFQCLLRATLQQRQIVEENFERKDPEKVAQVKAMYKVLELPAVFLKYEEDSNSYLKSLLEQYSVPPTIFLELAKKIYMCKSDLEIAKALRVHMPGFLGGGV